MRKARNLLLAGAATLALAACATMQAADQPPPSTTQSGTYLAAHFAAAAGDIGGAANYYSRMLNDDPTNPDLQAQAFVYAAEGGDIERAAVLAGDVIASDDKNRPAHLVRAAHALMTKDYAAVARDGSGPGGGALGLLTDAIIGAWAKAGAGDAIGAIGAIDSLNGQRGIEGIHAYHKALLLDYLGRNAEADAAYKEAVELMGTGPRASDAYGHFLLRQGRVDDAKALYTRTAAENPGQPIAGLALAAIQAGKTPAPFVSSPAEGAAEGLFTIAAQLSDQRNADTAILYLNLTLYLRPDFELATVLLADRYDRLEKYDSAIDYYGRIGSNSPYFPLAQVQGAIDQGRVGNPEQGIAKMKVLANASPGNIDIWTALGDLNRDAEHYMEAMNAYTKALAMLRQGDARTPGLLYARAIAYEHSNRWDDAEKDLQQAVKVNPNRADILNYLGYSWIDRGVHMQEAVTMLEKARALRPQDGYIADSVGWAYYRVGRYQEAAQMLEEAVNLSPGAADVNDHLGDAYWRVGRKLDARFQWNHALTLDPDPKEKPIIQRKLQFGLDAVAASGG